MRTQARACHAGLRGQGLCPKSTAAEPTGTANIKIKQGKTSNSQTGNANARCGTYKRGALPGSSSAPRERGVQACSPRCTRGHPGGIASSSLGSCGDPRHSYSILEDNIPRPLNDSAPQRKRQRNNEGIRTRKADTTSRTRSPRDRHTREESAREQCNPQSVNRH